MSDTPAAVEVRTIAGGFTLVLHGEFDVATVDVLADGLRDADDLRPGHVTVDLRDARFFGLTALDQVLDADGKLCTRGCTVEVVNATSSVKKMLAALDCEHLLAAGDQELLQDFRVSGVSDAAAEKVPAATA